MAVYIFLTGQPYRFKVVQTSKGCKLTILDITLYCSHTDHVVPIQYHLAFLGVQVFLINLTLFFRQTAEKNLLIFVW
jgi:hypothetical protein